MQMFGLKRLHCIKILFILMYPIFFSSKKSYIYIRDALYRKFNELQCTFNLRPDVLQSGAKSTDAG